MPERLSRASRAAPAGARPPLGQDQHNLPGSYSPSSHGLRPRICLRKGCNRMFQPQCWNQRYCQDPECLKLVRRWQAAKRQRQRRSRPEVRQERAAAMRQRRARHREQCSDEEKQDARANNRKQSGVAWSRSRKNSASFCDRPGCYEAPRPSCRCAARYCGDECRQAMRRVRDRERKWLSRKTAAGRFKRCLEYQTRRAARRAETPNAKNRASNLPAGEHSAAVVNYEAPSQAAVPCRDLLEIPAHDSQTPARPRPRAPPSA